MAQKHARRAKRRLKIRAKLFGTQERPRVSVFRSNQGLYVQLIDDKQGKTIMGFSDAPLKKAEKNKITRAQLLGKNIASEAKKQKLSRVIFDRGGYAYHGRVKALAEGLREGGLEF